MTRSLQLNYLPRINRAGERQSYGTNARVDFIKKSTFRLKKVSCRNSECVPIRHFGDIQVEVTDLLKKYSKYENKYSIYENNPNSN